MIAQKTKRMIRKKTTKSNMLLKQRETMFAKPAKFPLASQPYGKYIIIWEYRLTD